VPAPPVPAHHHPRGDAGSIPDLVARDFTADAPGTKLVGDITSWVGRRVGLVPAAWSARVLVEPLAE
jgi:hypothetical protein